MAAFRGHKLRLKPSEVRGPMLTVRRTRQTSTDLLEERERQYRDALSRDASGSRDVTDPTAAGQSRLLHRGNGRRHTRRSEPLSELDSTVRAFLDHVITLSVSLPKPSASQISVTSGHVTGQDTCPAPPSSGQVKPSSLYLDAARERARLTTAERKREEEAAVKIQSSWRGHRARQSLKQNKAAVRQPRNDGRSTSKDAQQGRGEPANGSRPVEDRRRAKKATSKPTYPASRVKGTRSRQSRGGRGNGGSTRFSYNMTPSRTQKKNKPAEIRST